MSKVWKWLGRVWATLMGRRQYVVDFETRDINGDPGITYLDLKLAIAAQVKLSGIGPVEDVMRSFGATIARLGLVPEDRMAECLRAIQSTTIAPALREVGARHTRIGVSPHREAQRLYEQVMELWVAGETFESKHIQAMFVARGYAPASHGPCLSDLTQLGWLCSLGGGVYGFEEVDPKGIDWVEEGRRLKALREARRR